MEVSPTESGGGGRITNSIISGNNAEENGGGFFAGGVAYFEIINSTFTKNIANTGGGIYVWGYEIWFDITNSILWNNSATEYPEIYDESYFPVSVTYSDIQGGYPGEGNIDSNPLFVDPANGDYHLTKGSPCIDSGTSENAPITDIDGDSRPQGAGYDIGADEYMKGGQSLNSELHHLIRQRLTQVESLFHNTGPKTGRKPR